MQSMASFRKIQGGQNGAFEKHRGWMYTMVVSAGNVRGEGRGDLLANGGRDKLL